MKPIDDEALDTMRQRLELAERADLPADTLRAVLARLDAAEERLREYENCVSWMVYCTSCAKAWDVNYDNYCREQASIDHIDWLRGHLSSIAACAGPAAKRVAKLALSRPAPVKP